MRLFTALDISAEVRANLTELVRQLSAVAPFHWSPPENLHITTKFIGELPADHLETLRRQLGAIARVGPIDVRVRGLAWFPNPHSPRVLFAGIEASPVLGELHRITDAACAATGVPAETKPYHPHLTLARLKSVEGLREARQMIAQLPEADFGGFPAHSFHLYNSAPGPGGSHYSKLEEFPLL